MSLSTKEQETLLKTLKTRFEKNISRHKNIEWVDVERKLLNSSKALSSLFQMDQTGGEPDVVIYDKVSDVYTFFDCSPESPKERRSLCYDREALNSRKEFKPKNTVIDMAAEMGVELLSEEDYEYLQNLGTFDTKTSSWLKTPASIRKLGGAIFADFRYGQTFVYHNGADAYYQVRGFRGKIKV